MKNNVMFDSLLEYLDPIGVNKKTFEHRPLIGFRLLYNGIKITSVKKQLEQPQFQLCCKKDGNKEVFSFHNDDEFTGTITINKVTIVKEIK